MCVCVCVCVCFTLFCYFLVYPFEICEVLTLPHCHTLVTLVWMNWQDNKQSFAAKQVNAETLQANIQAPVAATVATSFGQKYSRKRERERAASGCFHTPRQRGPMSIRCRTILTGL